jgi:hypothetical protein
MSLSLIAGVQTIPDESSVSPTVTRGFMILVVFFLGLLSTELLSGEILGVPAILEVRTSSKERNRRRVAQSANKQPYARERAP